MAFRLALALGVSHPDRLLEDLSAREFDEWLAYFQVEPWGALASDVRVAMLSQLLTALHTDPKKSKVPELREFLPAWQRQILRAQEQADREEDDEPEEMKWKRWKSTFEIIAAVQAQKR